jgi:hypothetical protein
VENLEWPLFRYNSWCDDGTTIRCSCSLCSLGVGGPATVAASGHSRRASSSSLLLVFIGYLDAGDSHIRNEGYHIHSFKFDLCFVQ